jgi:hypothetical protein
VLKERIDLNMLMDASDAGMPYSVWREDFQLPVPLLLRLRRMAIRWRSGYTGLAEDDKQDCREVQERDDRNKRRARRLREAEDNEVER